MHGLFSNAMDVPAFVGFLNLRDACRLSSAAVGLHPVQSLLIVHPKAAVHIHARGLGLGWCRTSVLNRTQ